MTLAYQSGDRIRGLSTDTLPLNVPDFTRFETTDTQKIYTKSPLGTWHLTGKQPRGGWVELARTTLGSSSTTIDVSSIPNKRYYQVLVNTLGRTGLTTNNLFRFGSGSADSGTNYADRRSVDGGTEATTASQTNTFQALISANYFTFSNSYISNLPTKEKLILTHEIEQRTAGAGNAPRRCEINSKWVNTVDPIKSLDIINDGTADFDSGADAVVASVPPSTLLRSA